MITFKLAFYTRVEADNPAATVISIYPKLLVNLIYATRTASSQLPVYYLNVYLFLITIHVIYLLQPVQYVRYFRIYLNFS